MLCVCLVPKAFTVVVTLDALCATGHSLGGSLAMLAAYDIAALLPTLTVRCYTYGAPRTGNRAFAEDYGRVVEDTWHIINGATRCCALAVLVSGACTLYGIWRTMSLRRDRSLCGVPMQTRMSWHGEPSLASTSGTSFLLFAMLIHIKLPREAIFTYEVFTALPCLRCRPGHRVLIRDGDMLVSAGHPAGRH